MKKYFLTLSTISVLSFTGITQSTTWLTDGNAGLSGATHFLGTTDNVPLVFKINNVKSGIIDLTSLNTALGYRSLFANTSGTANAATGAYALANNTSGGWNTAYGSYALTTNTTGGGNNAIGYRSLNNNTSGVNNVANGYFSLYSNTTGSENTATGNYSLFANTTGTKNTAHGYQSLYNSATGFNNTAIGYQTLAGSTGGANNTANGYQALYSASGFFNTGIGMKALYSNTFGAYNTAVGAWALQRNISGFYNVAIGYDAGTSSSFDNTVSIGNVGWANGYHNQAFIGNASTGWIGGWVGWSVYSDARIKTKITEDVKGLDFITRLRPVTYYKSIKAAMQISGNKETDDYPHKYDAEKIQVSGFLAQEVEKAAQESGYNFNGVTKPRTKEDLYSLSYEMFVVPLVKGMQEQQAIIEKLQERIEMLEKKLSNPLSPNNTSFSLSPNPASDYSILNSTNANAGAKSVVLYNSAGAAVWAQNNLTNSSNTIRIPLKEFAGGVYLLKIQTNEGWQTLKLIKQ